MKSRTCSAPYLVWAGIFIIVPMIIVLYFAFTNSSGAFTTTNVTKVSSYLPVILRSVWMGLLATAICLILGYPMAYIIAKARGNKQSTLLLLIMMPMWMNFLLRTYAWMTILEDTGLINRFLTLLHLPNVHIINTPYAVIIGMVYNFLPYMIMPIYAVMTKLDHSLVEAAEDLGGNNKVVFTKILFPLTLPGIISGITMVFVPSVSTFLISKMLGGNEAILIGDLIEMQFFGQAYNPHLGAAISLVLMVLILISMGFMNKSNGDELPMLV